MKKASVDIISSASDSIKQLELEIEALESELQNAELKINAFENVIRSQFNVQINQIRVLANLYKDQKKAKKLKRVEQKKRGKNYQQPEGLIKQKKDGADRQFPGNQEELKRLYKEAIVKVHPDKFQDEEESEKANGLTIELINIYKSGDLERLTLFHEHIVTGNAMSHVAFKSEMVPNPKSMLLFLRKKKEEIMSQLEDLKQSYTYTVLHTYDDPNTFLIELKGQFEQRIVQLQRRTR